MLPPPVPSKNIKLALMKQEGETLLLTGDVDLALPWPHKYLLSPCPRLMVKAPAQTTAKPRTRAALSNTGIGGRTWPVIQALLMLLCGLLLQLTGAPQYCRSEPLTSFPPCQNRETGSTKQMQMEAQSELRAGELSVKPAG